jgi:formyltetrahydrofolate deformylase
MESTDVTAVLLISCRDQKGLVATVADFLYQNGGNIIHADQHTDHEEGVFLQRVEWELGGFGIERGEIERAFRPIAERFEMTWSVRFSDEVPRMAILASKLPHCLYDLLARWKMGEFRAKVPLVISNHGDLRSIAEDANVQFEHVDVGEGKAEAERRIGDLLEEASVDVVVLAGPDHQHPPLVLAGVRRCAAVPQGPRARREGHRCDSALRDGGAR